MSTYNSPVDVVAATLARSSNINDVDAATAVAFAAIPTNAQLYSGSANYVAAGGAADAYTGTVSATYLTSLTDGLQINVKFPVANATTTPYFNLNGLGNTVITREDGTVMAANDITANMIGALTYSTTTSKWQFRPNGVAGASAAAASAAAAAVSAAASSASSTSASTYAAALSGTSTTSLLIAVASKSFTASTGKQWTAGQFLVASSAANNANFMHGTVTSYNSGSGALVMNVTDIGGSGTLADWNINVSGTQGPTGAAGSATRPRKTVTASTTVVAADLGAIVLCTNAISADFNLTLDAPATAGSGWFVTIVNESDYIATVVGTVNGVTNPRVFPNEAVDLQGDASTFAWVRLSGDARPGTVATAVVASATVSQANAQMCLCTISSTQGLLARKGTSGYPCVDLIDSGSNVLGTLTAVESVVANCFSLKKLTTTTALMSYYDSTNTLLRATVLSISGTTITAPTKITVAAVNIVAAKFDDFASATDAVLLYGQNLTSRTDACVITVSGTTPTANTIYSLDTTTIAGGSNARITAISATQFLAGWRPTASAIQAWGTVLTKAAAVLTFPAAPVTIAYSNVNSATQSIDLGYIAGSRVLMIEGGTLGIPALASVVTLSGTGTTAKTEAGRKTPVSGGDGGAGHRLAKVTNSLFAHATTNYNGTYSLMLDFIIIDGDTARASQAAVKIARNVDQNAYDVCIIGTKAVVAYPDLDNSGYATMKSVDIANQF